MGLDMYLEKRTYVNNWAHMKPGEMTKVTVKVAKGKGIKPERVSYVIEEVMYWRKANQIHNWFVEHCVESEDWNGDEVFVSREQLRELLDTCDTVLKASRLVKGKIRNGQMLGENGFEDIIEDGKYIEDSSVAEKLLPATAGFFFGSTEYDQYYVDDVKETAACIRRLLREDGEGDFHYSASW